MKISCILIIVLLSTSVYGQTTYSLETYQQYMMDDIPLIENSYIKDVNNTLDKFEGTYKGTYNDWKFEITLTKYTNTKTSDGFYEDFIGFRYSISNLSTGVNFNNNDVSPYYIRKSFQYPDEKNIFINWLDPLSERIGAILLTYHNNTELSISFVQSSNIYSHDEEIKPSLIPEDSFIELTKIN